MSIHCQIQRLGWISKNIPGTVVSDMEKVFRLMWKGWYGPELPNINLADSIYIHLIYSLFRHRVWCKTDLFSTILTAAIADEYGCDRNFVKSMVLQYIELIDADGKYSKRCDKEFLLYILIQATSPSDDNYIADEIGLGRDILIKLKGAADTASKGEHEDGEFIFLPELDDTFCQILKELSRELKRGSWVMDTYRLKFLLLEAPAPWDAIIHELGGEWILKVLLAVGEAKALSDDDLVSRLSQPVAALLAADQKRQAADLIEHLQQRQLIYATPGTNRSRTPAKVWHLTSLGEELTANLFAEMRMSKGAVREDDILGLNGSWQVAVIRRIPQSAFSTLLRALSSNRPLGSEAYLPALLRLREAVDHETLSELLKMRIIGGTTAGIRAAACKASVALQASVGLTDVLREISVSDPSFLVKESAVTALQKQGRPVDLRQI